MERFSVLLVLCAGNSLVTGEFHTQRPVKRNFDVFLGQCLNKQVSKQLWCWWFEISSRWLWRHCIVYIMNIYNVLVGLGFQLNMLITERRAAIMTTLPPSVAPEGCYIWQNLNINSIILEKFRNVLEIKRMSLSYWYNQDIFCCLIVAMEHAKQIPSTRSNTRQVLNPSSADFIYTGAKLNHNCASGDMRKSFSEILTDIQK